MDKPISESLERTLLKYVLIDRRNKSLLLMTPLGIQVWAIRRKPLVSHKKCFACKTDLKGALAYSPIMGNNLRNKSTCLCKECIALMKPVYPNRNTYTMLLKQGVINGPERN